MATKRRKKTATRRKKSLSSGGTTKRRKSARRRPKGFLNDMLNPTMAAHSAKSTLAAIAGGGGAIFVNKMIPATTGKLAKVAIAFGVGFLATNFGMANTGAGFTGGMMALSFQNGFLNDDDDTNFADEDSLSDMPLFLDDNGEPMVLEEGEDGQTGYRYLSDEEIESLQDFDEYDEVD